MADILLIIVFVIVGIMFFPFSVPTSEEEPTDPEICGDNKVIIDDDCVCAEGYYPIINCFQENLFVSHEVCTKCDGDDDTTKTIDGIVACNVQGVMADCPTPANPGEQCGGDEILHDSKCVPAPRP